MNLIFTRQEIFPAFLIVLDVCAGIVYLCKPVNVPKSVYWFGAAAITCSVTFFMKSK